MKDVEIWKGRYTIKYLQTKLDIVNCELSMFEIPSKDAGRSIAVHKAKGHIHEAIMALFKAIPPFPKEEETKTDSS